MRVLILLLVAATAVAALDDGSTVTLFEVKDNICGETVNFPAKYAKLAEKFDKNLKEGTCLSVGYTQFVKNTTKKTPIGTFTVEEFKKPSTVIEIPLIRKKKTMQEHQMIETLVKQTTKIYA